MIDIFMPIQSFVKIDKVSLDNHVFRMHYRLTVIMLLVFCVMVTSKQFFGEPIQCMGDDTKHIKVINNYCWIYGTYTLKSRMSGFQGKHYAYQGVGPSSGHNDDKIVHTYYQWVCFMFLGQAVMFYTPRYLWKNWEGGKVKTLLTDLCGPKIPKDWNESGRKELVSFVTHSRAYGHNLYAVRFAFCELLNLVNVVGQIYLLNVFLGGSFRTYGSAVTTYYHRFNIRNTDDLVSEPLTNPLDKYFPKMTKCFYHFYGPSGDNQNRDFICVLSLNIINEKIFIVLWFWLIFLSFLSAFAVLFRIMTFSLLPLRMILIMGQLREGKRRLVSKIVRRCNFGDWFILHLLGKNMNPILYKELILDLSTEYESKTVAV